FTYQGRLTDSGNPADGLFDMRFKLFDTATVGTGTELGTITNPSVQVQNGAFSVQLDFAPCASCFDGSERFLEISVRPAGSVDPYMVLGPRQPITAAPYALRALDATQLGGIAASGFIRNTTSQQAGTDFNISGSGTAGGTLTGGVVNAATRYDIGGLRMLAASGSFNNGTTINLAASNTFLGESAGLNTTPSGTLSSPFGKLNSFFGANAGKANTTAHSNSFFGALAGTANTSGSFNSFFGREAGASNSSGTENSFFGSSAGFSNISGGFNSFFGARAGFSNTGGLGNTFFGYFSGFDNTTGGGNSFFGTSAGSANTTGSQNSFFGTNAGDSNQTGNNNTIIGDHADTGTSGLTYATAVGARALVGQSNSLVLGSISGVNSCTPENNCASVNVGIGTATPGAKLTVSGTGDFDTHGAARLDLINTAAPISYLMHVTNAGLWQVATTAGTSRLAINTSGNVGIGTTTPSASLHVSRDTSNIANPVAIIESAGNQAPLAFRVEGPEVARIRADNLGNLVFVTLSGLSKNIIFRAGEDLGTDLIIQSTGNVGIGDSTPVDKLDVEGDIRVGTGTTGCVKDADGTVLTGTCSSDARLKREITPFPMLLDKVVMLRPVHFYWRQDEYKDKAFGVGQSFGLIAQEVEEVLPELVTEDEQGLKAVRYNKLAFLMLQAIKELKAENDALKQRLDLLSSRHDQLKKQQTEIENLKKIICLAHPHTEACK
ncbi:MAG TPA: tail fiber domain-containing protein, partial [Blastocatellia bacterium]|nr:tail fiber domain-containing protein [Blastocatellia bacterium]